MQIIVVKNARALSEAARAIVLAQLKRKKTSVLGLATGNTQIGLYRELVKAYRRKEVSFKKVTTFNLDEFAGLDDTDRGSLFGYMRRHFFDKVDLAPKNINMLDGRAKHLGAMCKQYEQAIKRAGGIDLQVLGIGSNGHIAWNEPGSSFKSRTRVVDLTPSSRRAQLPNFPSLRAMPRQGLTMGLGTIMEAREVLLLADGAAKAAIVAKALRGPVSPKVPASILQRHPRLTVILDEAAASAL